MKSGMRSIGLNAYATTKSPNALAYHGVEGCLPANQSVMPSRLVRFAQFLRDSPIPMPGSMPRHIASTTSSTKSSACRSSYCFDDGAVKMVWLDAYLRESSRAAQAPKGLPMQSLHEGRRLHHTPLRLGVEPVRRDRANPCFRTVLNAAPVDVDTTMRSARRS